MGVFGKILKNLSKEIGKTISKSTKSASQASKEASKNAINANQAQKPTQKEAKNLPVPKNADSNPSNTTSKYEIYSTITPQTKELAKLQSTKIRANLDFLKSTHPEIFSTQGQVFRTIKSIKDNPTHFYQQGNTKRDMSIIGKFLENGSFGEMGIVKSGENAGKVGHLLKSKAGNKRAQSLSKRENSGKVVGSDKTPHTDILQKSSSDGRAGKTSSLLPNHKPNSTKITPQKQDSTQTPQNPPMLPFMRE